ncbi:MAG: UPF0104 family protein [Planctomycetota bacterium]|nr:MAG: UPF0104 family protein [Planctomycetota bacterium]
MKKKALLFAKIFIALAFLFYLFQKGDLDIRKVARAFQRWEWLLVALALNGISMCVSVQRWRLLLESQGVLISFWKAFKIAYIGYLFNTFMPGSVGGDMVKGYYIFRKQKTRRAQALFSVLLDRVLGLISLVLLASIAALFSLSFFWSNPNFRYLLLLLFGISTLFLLSLLLFLTHHLKLPQKWEQKINPHSPSLLQRGFSKLYLSLTLYRKKPIYIFYAILLSLISHVLTISVLYCLAQTLHETSLTFGSYFVVVPIAMVVQAIPISFGAWGVGEAVFQHLFDIVAASRTQGANICLLWHMLVTFWNLWGILFYLQEKAEVDQLIQEKEEEEWQNDWQAPAKSQSPKTPNPTETIEHLPHQP